MNNAKAEFFELRKKVNEAIRHAWASGEPGKSYEGIWEVTCEYPGADEGDAEGPCAWMIVLHCYLLGPSRHYSWRGKTFGEALKDCKREVEQWCKAEMESGGENDG